jgi:anti-sigma regulatory factor (Ser/Thr protein kinase)
VQAVISLPPHPRSPRDARAFVRSTLHSWRLDDLCAEAELLASELVTNVVLHVGTQLSLTITRADGGREPIRVEVRDGSRRAPRRRHYSEQASTGRGLLLVERMATRHGVEVDEQGKRVWFELAAPRRSDRDEEAS